MRKHRKPAQSATSIDRSPQDDETARMKQYVLTMAVRTACLVLAFVLQPWGWHTALLSVGAIVLPYIAVVLANQANTHLQPGAEDPTIALTSGQPPAADVPPRVIRLSETQPPVTDEHDGKRGPE